MADKRKILNVRKFEASLLRVRAIHASELPDCAVNELIKLEIGDRPITIYEAALVNQSLARYGYFPNKSPKGGYRNKRDFKTCN